MGDWLQKLHQLKAEYEKEPAEAGPAEKSKGKEDQAHQLLKEVKAFEYLRDMRAVLLGDLGRIEFLGKAGGYDLVLALTWDGPISNPKRPKSGSPEMRHIFIGVHQGKLWVNGEPVSDNAPQALEERLLQAARNPGRRQELRRRKQ